MARAASVIPQGLLPPACIGAAAALRLSARGVGTARAREQPPFRKRGVGNDNTFTGLSVSRKERH